jgi:hypothetical protein
LVETEALEKQVKLELAQYVSVQPSALDPFLSSLEEEKVERPLNQKILSCLWRQFLL